MARRKSDPEENGSSQPTFEEALTGLESIIESMEHEHLALEDLVSQYEKGSALLSHCESILQSARGRIELITLRNQNEISLDAATKNGDASETHTTRPSSDDLDDEHDIRLF